MVDRPEPVAAGGVVGPAAGDALVAGWLGSRLAVRGVVDVVVDVGESSSEVEAVVTLKGKQFQVKFFCVGSCRSSHLLLQLLVRKVQKAFLKPPRMNLQEMGSINDKKNNDGDFFSEKFNLGKI